MTDHPNSDPQLPGAAAGGGEAGREPMLGGRRARAASQCGSALPPCRLHVVLARAAPVGVIFRRGPSKWYQLIKWNTQTDELDHGQWFHGRIYHRHADLSPNGELLVYGARAEQNIARPDRASYGYLWTAVSRPPYFTALALWPCSYDAAVGHFENDRTLWIGAHEHHPDHAPAGLVIRSSRPPEEFFLPGGPFFSEWRLIQDGKWHSDQYDPPRISERRHPVGPLGYPRLASRISKWVGADPLEEYSLWYDNAVGVPLAEVNWAEWDHRGRLVFARAGCLYWKDALAGPDAPERLIHDFNSARFRPLAPPDWAARW